MRGKEASSDTSAEGFRLSGAGLGTPPLRSRRFAANTRARAAKTRLRPRCLRRALRAPAGHRSALATEEAADCPAKCLARGGGDRHGPGLRASWKRDSV